MARPGDAVRRAGIGGNIGTALSAGIEGFGPYLQAHLARKGAEREARRSETSDVLKALGLTPVESSLAETLREGPIAEMLNLGPAVDLPGYERPRVLASKPLENVLGTKFGIQKVDGIPYYWNPETDRAERVPGVPEAPDPGSPEELARLFGFGRAQGTFWRFNPETGRVERAPGAPSPYTPATRGTGGGGTGARGRRTIGDTQRAVRGILSQLPKVLTTEGMVRRVAEELGLDENLARGYVTEEFDRLRAAEEKAKKSDPETRPSGIPTLEELGIEPESSGAPQDELEAVRQDVTEARRRGETDATIRQHLVDAGYSGDEIRAIFRGLP